MALLDAGLARSGQRRKLAGLPEVDEMLQAQEQPGQAGQNEGVQRRDHPGLGGMMVGLGTHGGGDGRDMKGQWLGLHN